MSKLSIADPLVRKAVYTAFKGRCFYTGRELPEDQFHIDHVVPVSKGGEDAFENYALAAPDINSRKGARDAPGAAALIAGTYAPRTEREYRRLVRQAQEKRTPKPTAAPRRQRALKTKGVREFQAWLAAGRGRVHCVDHGHYMELFAFDYPHDPLAPERVTWWPELTFRRGCGHARLIGSGSSREAPDGTCWVRADVCNLDRGGCNDKVRNHWAARVRGWLINQVKAAGGDVIDEHEYIDRLSRFVCANHQEGTADLFKQLMLSDGFSWKDRLNAPAVLFSGHLRSVITPVGGALFHPRGRIEDFWSGEVDVPARLWGVWVQPEHRGQGYADQIAQVAAAQCDGGMGIVCGDRQARLFKSFYLVGRSADTGEGYKLPREFRHWLHSTPETRPGRFWNLHYGYRGFRTPVRVRDLPPSTFDAERED